MSVTVSQYLQTKLVLTLRATVPTATGPMSSNRSYLSLGTARRTSSFKGGENKNWHGTPTHAKLVVGLFILGFGQPHLCAEVESLSSTPVTIDCRLATSLTIRLWNQGLGRRFFLFLPMMGHNVSKDSRTRKRRVVTRCYV